MNTKATAFAAVAIIIVATAVMLGIRFFSGPEDFWACQDGQWVKHGQPGSPMPEVGCAQPTEKNKNVSEKISPTNDKIADQADIKVSFPQNGNVIANPTEVVGQAKGTWFFEGSFQAKLKDDKGSIIAQAPAQALGEWMTSDFVPFRAVLEAPASFSGPATIVLSPDDPSGQGNEKGMEILVTIDKSSAMALKAYFSSLYFDPESQSCDHVYEVTRVVPKTKAVAKAALEQLLNGVTEEEKSGGYYSSINSGAKLNSISISNGIARADFNAELGQGVGGSCRTVAIIAQITQTLKQFPTVKNVVISIDGKSEAILQP